MKEFYYTKKGIYYKMNQFEQGRPTLVFVHGLTGSSSAWEPYEERFKGKYNILSFDLRGHGKSAKLKNYDDYAIKYFSDDLFELANELKLDNFILISHSFGTLVALEFLKRHREMARSAIFLSPAYNLKKNGITGIMKPIAGIAAQTAKIFPFSPRSKGHLDYSKYLKTGDWNARRIIADLKMTSLRVYLFSLMQSYEFDSEDFLGEIKIPCLMVHGKKDSIFPMENSILMAEKIKDSKLVLLDKADHIVVLNNFKEVSEAIEEFVEEK
jgi:pimeloyl-ACP methyl ester carboxylesterase